METEQNEPGMVRPWLLVVLVIVTLASIGFFSWNYYQGKKTDNNIATANSTIATPTPDTAIVVPTAANTNVSTADWKIYTDSVNGFSLKYPTDWNFNKDNNVFLQNSTNISDVLLEKYTENDCFVNFTMLSNKNNTTIEQKFTAMSANDPTMKLIQLGSNSFIKFLATLAGTEKKGFNYVTIGKLNQSFSFSVTPSLAQNQSCVDKAEQMLSTFQFTK